MVRKTKAEPSEKQGSSQLVEQKAEAKATPEKAVTRHIPEAVKDAVRIRDGFQCSYVSPDNVRCEATAHLQFDHVHPFGKGGGHGVENIRLLCRKHNQLMAERSYGKEFIVLKAGHSHSTG